MHSAVCNFAKQRSGIMDFSSYHGSGYWYWGKACFDKETGVYEVMGQPQTCKDYLVDIHYRMQASIREDTWTDEQKNDVCYWIGFPNDAIKERFLKNVVLHLNAWEKKHRLQKTTVEMFEVTDSYNHKINLAFIRGSKMWGRTTYARGFYLSMVRLMGYWEDWNVDSMMNVITDRSNPYGNCNEKIYFQRMGTTEARMFDKLYQNPRIMMEKLPDTHNITGYSKEVLSLGHGVTGFFFALQYYIRRAAGAVDSIYHLPNSIQWKIADKLYKEVLSEAN